MQYELHKWNAPSTVKTDFNKKIAMNNIWNTSRNTHHRKQGFQKVQRNAFVTANIAVNIFEHLLHMLSTWCNYLMCNCEKIYLFDFNPCMVCLFVCVISLTWGQLIIELFPDCTRSCFLQVVLRHSGGDCIHEMRCLFVAVGVNARFIVLPHWDNMSWAHMLTHQNSGSHSQATCKKKKTLMLSGKDLQLIISHDRNWLESNDPEPSLCYMFPTWPCQKLYVTPYLAICTYVHLNEFTLSVLLHDYLDVTDCYMTISV